MLEGEPVFLIKTAILVTQEATVIDFVSPRVDKETAGLVLEQFALEHNPSSVISCTAIRVRHMGGLPISSDEVMLWRASWEQGSKKPPEDFAIRQPSRN